MAIEISQRISFPWKRTLWEYSGFIRKRTLICVTEYDLDAEPAFPLLAWITAFWARQEALAQKASDGRHHWFVGF